MVQSQTLNWPLLPNLTGHNPGITPLLEGHHACLGNIVQNIAKMGGEPRASFAKVGSNRTNFNLSDKFYQLSI